MPDTATRFRIPVIRSTSPDQCYLVAVVVGDEMWGGKVPTKTELKLIRRYLDFKLDRLTPSWRATMALQPFDIDSPHGTLVLVKRGRNDWCYRWSHWNGGLVPAPFAPDRQAIDLSAALDRFAESHGYASKWRAWLAAHPAG